jgi:protein-disulfide isomerase
MLEKLSVPIAIVIAGGIVGGALYYSNLKGAREIINTKPLVGMVQNEGASNMKPVTTEDHMLGNPSADIIIVEYSDLECPFCKQYHVTLSRIMDEYGKDGKVAWVYRHFPIDSLHPKARKEAEATECANELGGTVKFWEYINMIYENTPSNNGLDPAQLPKFAKAVGLDVTAFNKCLSSGKYADKVEAQYQDAVKSGGDGTPNSILLTKDGTRTTVKAAQSYENLKAIIDALLK